ncbi:IclR family transcriptional regulator [Haloarcula sp. JP-L23]|uniref:IclR family transcriptional regulator n=1 Tax=Haloarcula sp. JP-L23 TaxID=2716717 RepID=UPI00140EC116|nr:IclR family transcriptional regulator [Haloarcula sp. JP-L23]
MENTDRRKTSATSLRVLDAVADLGGATLTEISTHMTMHESTLYKHLKTLEENGYIAKIDGKYHPSAKLFHLGKRGRERNEYIAAREELNKLYDEYEQETSFSIQQNGRILVLFDQSHDSTPEGFQVGEYYHMHSNACGKAILAEYSDARVREIIEKWGLSKEQDNTITNEESLFNELEEIRDSGYAINNQESMEGLRSLAVSVTKPSGDVLGAIDIFGPPYLLPPDEEMVEILENTARNIEEKIKQSEDSE